MKVKIKSGIFFRPEFKTADYYFPAAWVFAFF